MKRCRVTFQIEETERQKIDSLVYDHKAKSISDLLRSALKQFLKKSDCSVT